MDINKINKLFDGMMDDIKQIKRDVTVKISKKPNDKKADKK